MKTLIYSAWTCAFMSGMMLLAFSTITFAPAAQAEGDILAISAFFSLLFWAALALFLQWRSKKWTKEPSRALKIAALVFATIYMATILLFIA